MSGKRHFPYYSAVPEIELKRPALASVAPGRERAQPRVFQEGPGFGFVREEVRVTDFTEWTEQEIKAFLDGRGEDHDDCRSFSELVLRAQECEYSTGPATKADPPAHAAAPNGQGDWAEEEEADPLDAFMAEINAEVRQDKPAAAKPAAALALDDDDNVADFLEGQQAKRRSAAAAAAMDSGYNSDEEVYAVARAIDADEEADNQDPGMAAAAAADRKRIDPLPPVDHDSISYEDFAKDFYEEAADVAAMPPAEVAALRRELAVRVSGFDAPKPVTRFEQLGLDAGLLGAIRTAGYTKPTPIQAQALPAALSGRDVLGIAKTGSGKTAAFVLPMVVHILDQPELERGEGPIAVIVAPTRELAEQIHKEARKFGKPGGVRACAAFGGLSKLDQFRELKAGCEVAVCTPGRMIDLVKMKACTCRRVTFLVFDEADRMFDMGFEPQVRSILGQTRPDRQTLLFSATMPGKVERLVRDALTTPVRVTVGEVGAANEDIKQVAAVVEEIAKLSWLKERLPAFVDAGEVLVFAGQKARVELVVEQLKAAGFRAAGIHGDIDQAGRMAALADFRAGRSHVLVATDVASRGLDIKSIRTVVSLDAPRDIDTHVHRVGRTGRAGDRDGVAYTLVTPGQAKFAGELVTSLAAANQEIPPALAQLAARDRRGGLRGRKGGGGGRGRGRRAVGGAGLGFGDGAGRGAGDQGVFGGAGLRGMYAGRFKTSFVASGTAGGDIGQRATIVAARQAPARAAPPPPAPVAALPAAFARPAPSNVNSASAQAAIAAAQAIAARLSASAGGGAAPSNAVPGSYGNQPFDYAASMDRDRERSRGGRWDSK
ncbi:hypothetical protein WJX81_004205 [Elliptochloris bilobata]|uniref:RNA helicase n=1 Tax=Elliptochloris bilobata TaxID=381761 RepID=A0AAW1SIG6_9CHLO